MRHVAESGFVAIPQVGHLVYPAGRDAEPGTVERSGAHHLGRNRYRFVGQVPCGAGDETRTPFVAGRFEPAPDPLRAQNIEHTNQELPVGPLHVHLHAGSPAATDEPDGTTMGDRLSGWAQTCAETRLGSLKKAAGPPPL